MNTNFCEDCNKTTSGKCWKHRNETVVIGPAETNSVFIDNAAHFRIALQKLVNKLEMIEKDNYVQQVHSWLFPLWKNELAEAKKVLEESNKPPIVLCTGYTTKDVDLFDLPPKDENEA